MNFHNHETEPMPPGAAQSHEQPMVEKSIADALMAEVGRLKQRLLSAAGDDLCRLSQEEIKAYTSGAVKIPPIEEFLPSCARFHAQIADEAGVLDNCLTLAQLIADNERLTQENAALRELVANAPPIAASVSGFFGDPNSEKLIQQWMEKRDSILNGGAK